MRIAVESQLTGYAYGQRVEHSEVLGCEVTLGKVNLLVATNLLSLRHSKHIVQLGNKLLDGWDELNDTLRNDYSTEVVTICSTYTNGISNVVNDIVETHGLGLNLLRNEADVGLCLQGALQSNVRSRTTHHLDEVPVFTCRITVALDVTNQLRVGLTSGIETK